MRVDWAIPCRYTEVHDNLATIIGGGISHLWPPQLPTPVGIMLAIRLVFLADEIETDTAHHLRVAAMAPDGSMLSEVAGDMNIGSPIELPGDELHGIHMPMAVQFMAENEGTYMLEITVDGHTTGVPLRIAQRPAEGPSPGP